MRVGLIADLHGNPVALDAVLAALEAARLDTLVCLGDVAVFGPDPRGVVARLRDLGCPVVMGNTDAWALDPAPHPPRDADTPYVNAIELWGAAQLDDDDRAFIRSFAPTVTVDLGGGQQMLCYHGSPRSFHEGIFATTPDEQLADMLAGFPQPILAGAHTHSPLLRRYADRVIVNPGSVGQAFERRPNTDTTRHAPWAEYAVLEANGPALRVELCRTPVDVEAVVRLAYARGMPHAEWWAARWG